MTAGRFRDESVSAICRLLALSISAAAIVCFADASAAVAAAGDRGAQLAATCASCHRLDGRDVGIPSIVGLDAATLTEAMHAFQSGARVSQIMHVMSLSLSDDEIANVSSYLATLHVETHRP